MERGWREKHASLVDVDGNLLLVGVGSMSRAPLFKTTLLLQVFLPFETADPLVEDQGDVETNDHANNGQDSGDQGTLLATIVALGSTVPLGVTHGAALVDIIDVVLLNGNVDNGPAKEHQEESPRGGNELAMVPGVALQ